MNVHDTNLYKEHPEKFKLRYVYRKFNINIPTLTKDYREFIQSPIDISKAYSSQYVIGLCLTYHVNYGLSYRQTASILQDVHEVYISYKTTVKLLPLLFTLSLNFTLMNYMILSLPMKHILKYLVKQIISSFTLILLRRLLLHTEFTKNVILYLL